MKNQPPREHLRIGTWQLYWKLLNNTLEEVLNSLQAAHLYFYQKWIVSFKEYFLVRATENTIRYSYTARFAFSGWKKKSEKEISFPVKNSSLLLEVNFPLNGLLLWKLGYNFRRNKDMSIRRKSTERQKNHRAKQEPLTVIHGKMCNKFLFTEKYDSKSPLAPFEECSPSITAAVPVK